MSKTYSALDKKEHALPLTEMSKGKPDDLVVFIPVQDIVITQISIIGRYRRAKVYIHNISRFIVKNVKVFYMTLLYSFQGAQKIINSYFFHIICPIYRLPAWCKDMVKKCEIT